MSSKSSVKQCLFKNGSPRVFKFIVKVLLVSHESSEHFLFDVRQFVIDFLNSIQTLS